MNQQNQILKCALCGQLVQALSKGPKIKCCSQGMELMAENTVDAAVEKHVPVVEKTDNGIKVKVGEVAHPMADDHYIQWIEVLIDEKVLRCHLKPGGAPEAEFCIDGTPVAVRAYCNLHGHWKA